jgi:hypothetical protein
MTQSVMLNCHVHAAKAQSQLENFKNIAYQDLYPNHYILLVVSRSHSYTH